MSPNLMSNDPWSLPDPPAGIAAYLRRTYDLAEEGGERRVSQRQLCIKTILVHPLSADGRSEGPRFKAITRDVSTTGLSFASTQYFPHPCAEVSWLSQAGVDVRKALRVVRCVLRGHLYIVAGEFDSPAG